MPGPPAGHVFVVDDEPTVRRALGRQLRSAGHAVEVFASADEFLTSAQPESGPCCLVCDLRLPGPSGLELQEELGHRGLELPIVFISGRADVSSGVRAMKGGAVDFLEKPFSDRQLLSAVGNALERDRQARTARVERGRLEGRLARLTRREREVFTLVAAGLGNKQVGWELGATEKTIKVHRARVMEKMEAGSLAELVRMADSLGVRPPSGTHQGS